MLRGIAKSVDDLERERLLRLQALHLGVRQTLPHTVVEAHRLLGSGLPDPCPLMDDGGLEDHLETPVELDQHGFGARAVPRAIEVINRQRQRVDRAVQ